MARPYISLGIDDLIALSADTSLHDQILHELSFRRTSKAQALARRLGGTTQRHPGSPSETGGKEEAFQRRYEALRQTFTEAGELLAQWGMTESLPQDLIKIVLAEWKVIVTSEQNSSGKTLQELEELQRNLLRLGVLSND